MKADQKVVNTDKIRIKAGAEIHTTHPKGACINKRQRVVQCHTTTYPSEDRVTWRGSGGYWFWCDKKDAELLEETIR